MNVALFIPCYIDQFYPRVGIATLELLEKLGCNVSFPMAQTCCGQPLANSGHEDDAVDAYLHFVETFSTYDYIVAPSGSCSYHVRKHYDILEQTKSVQHVRSKTLDLPEFLVDILEVEKLDASFHGRVGLHHSCHGLRGLRLGSDSERVVPAFSKIRFLLSLVEGIEIVEADRRDECCGFGGTYAVHEHALSVKMGQDRIEGFTSKEVEFITAGDMSCLMHLEGIIKREKSPVEIIHIAEILNHRN